MYSFLANVLCSRINRMKLISGFKPNDQQEFDTPEAACSPDKDNCPDEGCIYLFTCSTLWKNMHRITQNNV